LDTVFTFANLLSLPREAPAPQKTAGSRGVSLAFEGVTYRAPGAKGGPPVLESIDLEVKAGELVVIVGPSGCGKSTLLNLVAGLLEPQTGRVACDGKAVKGAARERALVFQEAALFPWLTLRDNVEFPLKLQGMRAAERRARVDELLALVHLGRWGKAYSHELSGGMRQRGAIARALAADPQVLLMDEPFGAVDPETRENLQDEVERLWMATGKTILFVTHGLEEGVRLGDRVIVLGARPGRIVADARIDLPRPRKASDPAIASLARAIGAQLADEVQKARASELPDESSSASPSARLRIRNNLGAGI
jgi:NitT/TauT family transport system ATP-binding protein